MSDSQIDRPAADANDQFLPPMPRAVREAADRANALVAAANAPRPEPEPEPEPLPQQQQFQQPQPEPKPEPAAGEETWEQRYRSFKGRSDRDIAELRTQLRLLESEAARQRQMIIAFEVERANAPPAAAPAPTVATPQFSDADKETYGEDFMRDLQRNAEAVARAALMPEIQRLQSEVRQLGGRTEAAAADAAQSRVQDTLDNQVTNWRSVNVDPEFTSWLAQVDPFSGEVRHKLMVEAYKAGASARVVSFFQAFEREHTAINPGLRDTPLVQQDEKVPLEDLAAPGRQRPRGPGAPQEQRSFTSAEIARFYREKTQGRWDRDPAGALRVEEAIVAAAAAGRVR